MKKFKYIFIVAALAFALAGFLCFSVLKQKPLEKIVIADGSQPLGASFYAALSRNFFAEEGLEVTLLPFLYGKLALDALIEGKADFAIAAETPFVNAILEGKSPMLLATIGKAENYNVVIGRKKSGIREVEDLRGKKIGLPEGTSAEYFLNLLLNLHGIKKDEVKVVNIPPEEMLLALTEGSVDAVSIWGNLANDLYAALQPDVVFFEGDKGTFTYWNLHTLKARVGSNPASIEKILRALKKGSHWCESHPDKCLKETSHYTQISPDMIRSLWPNFNFDLSLTQALLVSNENLARIFFLNKNKNREIPNMLNYFYTAGMKKVSAVDVTLIE